MKQHFVLTGIDTVSEYRFVFPTGNASAISTIRGVTECLIYHHGIPQSIASDQEAHFTEKELEQWSHAHEIHWSYHFPHYPEIASLREW